MLLNNNDSDNGMHSRIISYTFDFKTGIPCVLYFCKSGHTLRFGYKNKGDTLQKSVLQDVTESQTEHWLISMSQWTTKRSMQCIQATDCLLQLIFQGHTTEAILRTSLILCCMKFIGKQKTCRDFTFMLNQEPKV